MSLFQQFSRSSDSKGSNFHCPKLTLGKMRGQMKLGCRSGLIGTWVQVPCQAPASLQGRMAAAILESLAPPGGSHSGRSNQRFGQARVRTVLGPGRFRGPLPSSKHASALSSFISPYDKEICNIIPCKRRSMLSPSPSTDWHRSGIQGRG